MVEFLINILVSALTLDGDEFGEDNRLVDSQAQQTCAVRESADRFGVAFDLSLFARSSGLVE